MLAIPGGSDGPQDALVAAARSRIRSRVPLLVARCLALLRLAEIGAQGPDPEAALAQLAAAERSLASFLNLTPKI